jgi:hypothetical protein
LRHYDSGRTLRETRVVTFYTSVAIELRKNCERNVIDFGCGQVSVLEISEGATPGETHRLQPEVQQSSEFATLGVGKTDLIQSTFFDPHSL